MPDTDSTGPRCQTGDLDSRRSSRRVPASVVAKRNGVFAIETFKAGLDQAVKKSLKETYPSQKVERLVGQGDALTDALYFIMGSFVEAGLEPGPLFEIVQQANMAKLGPDGQPIFRESDQKVMKPAGWLPPEPQLEAEVVRRKRMKKGSHR
ncbi:hypothetical protein [Exiguobacterium antarcticum]|uniref:hypothetical protein n=1 Tax=Exiguobacterium antarcticum TaxID=132920 RepID=UPI000285E983|nr:hypothetical protein [Exiguobacterium antarcticum]AFS70175.1 Hypothetical protein Eab7_1034 [Exiguobacterium antarcticum B7]